MSCKSLEYEVSGLHSDFSIGERKKPKEESGDEASAIQFSSKLIDALEAELREFNKLNPDSTASLAELKDIYGRGARNIKCLENKTLGEWAYARVNMFLRMKSEGKVVAELRANELSLENLDLTEGFVPSLGDFDSAKEKITKYDLSYDFKSVDELYIENYKNVSISW
jgi:hypothetical protein